LSKLSHVNVAVERLRERFSGASAHLPEMFMRSLFVSSEIYPLAKTGGLADVSAALPLALSALGVDVRLVMPGYPEALDTAEDVKVAARCTINGASTRVLGGRLPDSRLTVWLVDCPALFKRAGGLYQNGAGEDWHDNHHRFSLLSQTAAKLATGEMVADWRADVVHANDWHTGLLPLLLKRGAGARPASLFTVHNLAFQGLFPAGALGELKLPEALMGPDGIEFYGRISFLKAGIRYSDRCNTVSPSYAREILSPDFGCGLDGLLNERAGHLSGILNGIDSAVWNPASDPFLPARFDAQDMTGKHVCKTELQRELGLAVAPDTPLIVWASRLAHQKMADTALEMLPALMERDVQFALIGQGDPAYERSFAELARAYPGRVAARIGYQEPLAHRFYAGGDILLHPSRFEPCGLTPQYAMRYGTLPVVTAVGGLTDTVRDADARAVHAGTATGFSFQEQNAPAMLACLDRALATYGQPIAWRRLQRQAMGQDFGWQASAERYLALYRELAPLAPQVAGEPVPLAPAVAETEDEPIAAA
jgi:starch synthase